MSMNLSRRGLLGTATALPLVGVPALAAASSNATSAFLTAFEAAKRRLEDARREYDLFDATVYQPHNQARLAALQAIPHHRTVQGFDSYDGTHVHLTTENEGIVAMARAHLRGFGNAEPASDIDRDHIETLRELVDAADRREAEQKRIKAAYAATGIDKRLDAIGEGPFLAIDAALAIPAGSIADMAMKVDFADEQDWWDDDTIDVFKADIRRLAGEGR